MSSDKIQNLERHLVVILILIGSIICLSPLFLHFFPLKGNIISLGAMLIVYLMNDRIGTKTSLGVILLILITIILNSLYWNQPTLKVTTYFIASLLVTATLRVDYIELFVKYLTNFLYISLIGALIGLFYAYYGGQAIFTFENEDTRPNSLYLTTFSSLNLNGLIRPSGLFDEPGSLSFIICICVALREYFQMKRKTSWILLSIGAITLSTAHIIFFALFWIKVTIKSPKKIILSVFLLSLIMLFIFTIDSPVRTVINYILWKFSFVDGALVADNRTSLIINSLSFLDWNTFIWGIDGNCIMGMPGCIEKGFSGYCCNPFTIIVHYGIFGAWPFYGLLGLLLFWALIKKDLIIFGVFLLLLQRPYVMAYGYSFILMMYFYLHFIHMRTGLLINRSNNSEFNSD